MAEPKGVAEKNAASADGRASSQALSHSPERSPSFRSRLAVAFLGLAALVAIGSAAAIAGSCRVLVAIGSVDMEPSPAGMSMRVSGSWEFDNIVQVVSGLSFNVLLVREDNFVRFHYPDSATSGFVAGLGAQVDEGIDGNDILAVEAAGNAEPTARFVSFEAQRMKLSSPVPAGEGPISVVAYLVLDGDYVSPIISNTITRPLEMLPPPGTNAGDDGTVPDPIPPVDPNPPVDPAPTTTLAPVPDPIPTTTLAPVPDPIPTTTAPPATVVEPTTTLPPPPAEAAP